MTLPSDQQLRCCDALLNERLTRSGSELLAEDPRLLMVALRYLSAGVVDPKNGSAMAPLHSTIEVRPTDLYRILSPLRRATFYRQFIGEWIRGEVLLEAGNTQSFIAPLTDERRLQILALPSTELTKERDTMGLFPTIRRALQRRFTRSFSGTPGLTSYVDKDESPE